VHTTSTNERQIEEVIHQEIKNGTDVRVECIE